MSSPVNELGQLATTGLFIGGEEQNAADKGRFAVYAPADGAHIGTAARAQEADVKRAVAAAQRAFPEWWNLPPGQREQILLRVADAVATAGPTRLLDVLIDESGSTISKARFEIQYTAELLRTAAGEVRRLYGDTFPNDNPARMSMVFREPLGVIAVISPFNAPLALLAKMVAFPLAAGNTVVAKPSEETPLVAVELARIAHEAGLPLGVLNIVTGYGEECGRALVAHPGVAGIAFTGSTAVGTAIAQLATKRLCRMQLELGGKNPLLIFDDADPVAAAQIAAAGAFAHAGQICMANSRLIVAKPIAKAFAEALVDQASSLILGDLRDPRTAYGPLINRAALDKVTGHVTQAVAGGAELLTGGSVDRGLVYQPTVLRNPKPDSDAWRQETFGPVVSIVEVDSVDAAIDAANDSDYGLSAAIITNDLDRGLRAARRIRAGAVHLGMHAFQSNALAPVGGIGASGLGRSGGKYSIEHFTELKWVSVELGALPLPS